MGLQICCLPSKWDCKYRLAYKRDCKYFVPLTHGSAQTNIGQLPRKLEHVRTPASVYENQGILRLLTLG